MTAIVTPAATPEVGFRFDATRGRLIVDLPPRIGAVLELDSWQNGLTVRAFIEGAWEDVDTTPAFSLTDWIEPDTATPDTIAVAAYLDGVPASVRDRVRTLGWHQIKLLQVARAVPELLPLVDDSPVLVALLIDWIARTEATHERARWLVLGPRPEILRAAGIASTAATVKLLGRLRFERIGASDLTTVRELLANTALTTLLALFRRINGELLRPLLLRPSLTSLPFIRASIASPAGVDDASVRECFALAAEFGDVERVGRRLGVRDPTAAYRACTTAGAVRRLHDRWTERLNGMPLRHRIEALARTYGTDTFPAPPLLGSDAIVPITTLADLMAEGAELHHCVGSYHEQVMSGRCYIYRVLVPERATLEVVATAAGVVIRQIRGVCNQPVSAATVLAGEEWVRRGGGTGVDAVQPRT